MDRSARGAQKQGEINTRLVYGRGMRTCFVGLAVALGLLRSANGVGEQMGKAKAQSRGDATAYYACGPRVVMAQQVAWDCC